jgi:hypothetical protein
LSEVKYLYGLFFKQNEFINTDFFKKELENLSAKELENENKILKITKTIEIDKNMNYSVKLKEAIRFANLNISDLFYEILYIDGEEFVEIKNAYIFKENGDFIKIKDYDSLIPYEYDGLYSDMRILKFNLKDLIKKGDVFYVDYKITSTDKRNYFNNKISILDNIKPTSDIIYYKYSIKYPKSVKFKVAYNNNLLKKEELVEEEYNTLIFTAQNLKQFIEEPYYYFSYKEEAYISISNFLNWNEVKEWFKKIIFDKSYELSDKNKTFFKQLVSENNLKEKEDIIKFFYNYILDNIHYIGIELGIHSYKPYPPNVAFENKYGDCKDRVILFYHIMKLFDINVDFVLVASSNSGIYNFEIPSYSYFNHAIVYIPSINKFLDLTDKNTPYSYLPISDINSKILILDKEKNIEILKVKNRDKIIKEFIYTKIKNDVKVNHIESYYGNTLTSDLKIDFKLLDSFVYERYINKYYANNVDFKSYKSENEVRSEVKVFNFEYILKNMVNNNVAIIKLFQDDDLFESKFTPNNIRVNSFLFITKFNYEYKFKFNNLNKIYNFNNKIIDNTFFKAMLIFKDGTIKFNFEMKVNKISAQENNNFKIKLKELDELLQKKYYLEVK